MTTKPPTGTVTFLFTDIVGSTEAWEQHGDAFLPVLQAHNAILTDAISRYGGFLVKTEGDAYKVAFSDPVAAAKCAVVAQAALQRYPWPEDVGPLSVRIAIHTGDPFAQGGDYFGPPVNRTARILSTTHGGQILISEETFDRIENRMETGTRFIDMGFHTLKDLGEPARLYQLEHPALELHNFPAPRSLNGHAHNLPVNRPSFIGREKQIEQITALLTRADTPVLTLTGPGGIGKTSLSLQVAAERIELFPDGVWFVRLEAAQDVVGAALEVAETLGIKVPQGADPMATVRDHLAERQCLLILDDCGHVPQADKLLRELLSGSSSLRCLATSRQSLQLAEGAELAIPEMSLPGESAGAGELMTSEAGRLFVERAHEGRSDLQIDDRRAATVSNITRRSGGIPALVEKLASMMHDRRVTPKALDNLSEEVLSRAGQAGHAVAEKGRELLSRLRESPGLASFLQSVGSVAADRREYQEAEHRCREALAIYKKVGDKPGIATSLWQLGNIAFAQGHRQRAVTLLSAALQAATEIQSSDVNAVSVDLAFARRELGLSAKPVSLPLEQAVALAMGES